MNGPTSGGARVVGEWVYDAYGEPIFASNPHPHAVLKCGHKGLFFDRLDAGVYDPDTGGEMDRLVPDARGLYYARNRHHKPDWGRWLQQDPNATGLPVQAGLAFHGETLGVGVQGFNLGTRFGDGGNLFAYLGGSPFGAFDPNGLDAYSVMGQMATMGMWGGLIGIVTGGIYGGIQGGLEGAMHGAAIGGLAGIAGGVTFGAAIPAFGASAAGLYGALGLTSASGVSGLVANATGSIAGQLDRGGPIDWRQVRADAAWGACLGMVGGAATGGVRWRMGADDIVLQSAGAQAVRTIRFGANDNQINHAFRHTDAMGLPRADVEQAVLADLIPQRGFIQPNTPFNRVVAVAGKKVQYTAYLVDADTINVGRIHGVP